MSQYTQIPPHSHQPPVTVWRWAADLDQLATDIDAGRARGSLGPDGRPILPAACRALAASFRVNALVGVLLLDGVPAMEEGWALPPHPVQVAQDNGESRSADCPDAVVVPAVADFDEAVTLFYEALDRAARACGRGARTHEPCAPCASWADRHLAMRLPVR
ncbi:hypothetical protein ACFXKF_36125 [Streptomyces scopuliridis]|uniref:hypothetical protein n=1 Tax=Streptomyces scopuliridis TaxID=452529 RepID=UPI0036737F38